MSLLGRKFSTPVVLAAATTTLTLVACGPKRFSWNELERTAAASNALTLSLQLDQQPSIGSEMTVHFIVSNHSDTPVSACLQSYQYIAILNSSKGGNPVVVEKLGGNSRAHGWVILPSELFRIPASTSLTWSLPLTLPADAGAGHLRLLGRFSSICGDGNTGGFWTGKLDSEIETAVAQ
jgi:hypothetical protein